MINISKEQIIIASQNTKSAPEAAKLLGISYNTYKKYAEEIGCFKKYNRINVTDEEIIEVSKNSKSSITAAITLGIKYETYKKHAKRLGCFIERQDRLTQKEYLDKVNKVNPNIEVLGEYINIKTKIKHKCKICNYIWNVSPNDIRNGNGCPKCNQSKGEKEIIKYLDNLCIVYETQKTFKECKLKRNLKFDFYIPTLNMCIEYDGRQHFEPVDFSGKGESWAKEQFERIKYRDSLKNLFCVEHNIKLIRISYRENISKKLDDIFTDNK